MTTIIATGPNNFFIFPLSIQYLLQYPTGFTRQTLGHLYYVSYVERKGFKHFSEKSINIYENELLEE